MNGLLVNEEGTDTMKLVDDNISNKAYLGSLFQYLNNILLSRNQVTCIWKVFDYVETRVIWYNLVLFPL